jgi:glycosyltransferase involved in cell wall biosynthesis
LTETVTEVGFEARLNVLITVPGFPPTFYAGAERAAERIALWLAAHGHQVHVFTCEKLDDPNTRLETRVENGIVVHRLYYEVKDGDNFQNLYDDARVGEALKGLLEANSYDVMHVVSGYLMGGQVIPTAKEFGLPIVLTLTEFWFMCFRLNLLTANNELCVGPETDDKCARCTLEEKRRFRLPAHKAPVLMDAFWSVARHAPFVQAQKHALARRRETLLKALAAADVVICPSRFLMTKFKEYGFDTSRAEYLPYGIKHPTPEARAAAKKKRQPNALRLGYVGQIKPHKGVDIITDAAMPLLDAGAPLTLEIWGSSRGATEYGERLRQRTAAYAGIKWLGSYNGSQLWKVLGGFDALVVPSRWYENIPTVILEAFAMGLPVIATNLGSMPEVVNHDECGLLFEKDDVTDLRRQIKRLLDEPGLLARLATGIAKIPTIDDEIGAFYRHYQQLASRSTGSSAGQTANLGKS